MLMTHIKIPISVWAARTTDAELLQQSTSGGAFTELARVVLSDGGVVCGAAWEAGTFRVVHKFVETEEGLAELRGSKYVVSDMSGVYRPLRRFLAEGRTVLFVGTPCQTAAIRKSFGADAHLLLCSLVCMGNVENSIWQSYLKKMQRRARSCVVRIQHRRKCEGERINRFVVEFANPAQNIDEPLDKNEYWGLYCSNHRRVCSACSFKSGKGQADLQIGDFWGIENLYPDWADHRGVNCILVFSEPGRRILLRSKLNLRPATYEQVLCGNPYLEGSHPLPQRRRLGGVRRIARFLMRFLRH